MCYNLISFSSAFHNGPPPYIPIPRGPVRPPPNYKVYIPHTEEFFGPFGPISLNIYHNNIKRASEYVNDHGQWYLKVSHFYPMYVLFWYHRNILIGH